MTSLTPEQRLDKNGHLVTRHVRTVPNSSTAKTLPKPVLGASKQQQKKRKPSTTQKKHNDVRARWSDERLNQFCLKKQQIFRFTCSDAEAYDVFSVLGSPDNTIRLLAAGIRTKEDAIKFLNEHDLSDLQKDGSAILDEVIARGIPVIPAMESLIRFGLDWQDNEHYFDAVEANSVRALREATGSAVDVPHMVWMGDVSLSDVKVIGATRLAASPDAFVIMDRLKAINSGESAYDVETLRQLIILGETNSTTLTDDPIRTADRFGADMVLSLKYYSRAMNLNSSLRKTQYTIDQRAEILRFNDALLCEGKSLNTQNVRIAYDAGVEVQEVVEGLNKGLEVEQIAAVKEGIAPSVTSGWL